MDTRQNKTFLTSFIKFLTIFLLWAVFALFINNFIVKNSDSEAMIVDKNLVLEELNLDKFNLVYKKLKKYYYDFPQVEKKDLEEAIIKWLVNWLDDPYTEYFNLKENEYFQESLTWDFEWIWAVLEKHDLWVKIVQIIDGSPAKEADIRPGDIVWEVNDENISWMSTEEVVSLIRWPEWKEVTLTIIRWDEFLEKTLKTRHIIIPSVEAKSFDDEIGYIWLSTFWENTSEEFKKELQNFKDKKWIIIDLRYNWGWYLDKAVDILSNFIEKWKTLVITKYRNESEEKMYSKNKWEIYNWKIVVLVNEFSASASEILVWALRDYNKAIIVWQKTYGKWSVQTQENLSDGSMVKITIAKWFTPNDINIDKEWITPDVEVSFKDEDYENNYDRQLEEAKKVLKSFIENDFINLSIDKYKNWESISENNKWRYLKKIFIS